MPAQDARCSPVGETAWSATNSISLQIRASAKRSPPGLYTSVYAEGQCEATINLSVIRPDPSDGRPGAVSAEGLCSAWKSARSVGVTEFWHPTCRSDTPSRAEPRGAHGVAG